MYRLELFADDPASIERSRSELEERTNAFLVALPDTDRKLKEF